MIEEDLSCSSSFFVLSSLTESTRTSTFFAVGGLFICEGDRGIRAKRREEKDQLTEEEEKAATFFLSLISLFPLSFPLSLCFIVVVVIALRGDLGEKRTLSRSATACKLTDVCHLPLSLSQSLCIWTSLPKEEKMIFHIHVRDLLCTVEEEKKGRRKDRERERQTERYAVGLLLYPADIPIHTELVKRTGVSYSCLRLPLPFLSLSIQSHIETK